MSASEKAVHSGPVLDGILQHLFKNPPQSVRRKKDSKRSAYDEPSVAGKRETAELVADMLRPGGYAPVVGSAQQVEM